MRQVCEEHFIVEEYFMIFMRYEVLKENRVKENAKFSPGLILPSLLSPCSLRLSHVTLLAIIQKHQEHSRSVSLNVLFVPLFP